MKRLLNWKKQNNGPMENTGISYRIMFVSPFFELEVSNGYHDWQPVRSQQQINVPLNDEEMTSVYPLLHFKSFGDAEAYARTHLGLVKGPSWWSRMFGGPPASREKMITPVGVTWPFLNERPHPPEVISASDYLRGLSKVCEPA